MCFNRVSFETDIAAADFAKIYSAEHGRNDTRASTANTGYFGQTDARVPKVRALQGREWSRIHVARRYDEAGRGLYSRG